MGRSVKVGVLGLGTVASGFLELTRRKNLEAESSVINIILVASRTYKKTLLQDIPFTEDIFEVVDHPEIDIVIELMGDLSVALPAVKKALENGKHVVTANKALIAEHGVELYTLAEKNNCCIGIEATVAGGIPIINALNSVLKHDVIERVMGIINGTNNYILSQMRTSKLSFEKALDQALELGYAEADPSFDIDGIDAAHKISILSSLSFRTSFYFHQVFIDGIRNITLLDLEQASERGYQVAHIAVSSIQQSNQIDLRVHLALIPLSHILSKVEGVMNAVSVTTKHAGETLYYGAGAGDYPTGLSVLSDVLMIGANHAVEPYNFSSQYQILPMEEITFSWYFRFNISNKEAFTSVEKLCEASHIAIRKESFTMIPTDKSMSCIGMVDRTKVKHVNHLKELVESSSDIDEFFALPIEN